MTAREELQVVRLRDDFYRDGFYKILFALATIFVAIGLLVALSVYLYFSKPAPIHFRTTDHEWRVLGPVPLDQQYISTPDLIQWVSEVLPKIFTYDFIRYTDQVKNDAQYFTTNGWQKFLDQVNVYANYNGVQSNKLFINSFPAGAPFILNQGLLNGKYAWWVQMPVNITYINLSGKSTTPIVIQALVVRVPTLNNLSGVGIDNMIITKGGGDQIQVHG
jgi:intracellular multiplication protein IcmL